MEADDGLVVSTVASPFVATAACDGAAFVVPLLLGMVFAAVSFVKMLGNSTAVVDAAGAGGGD